MKKYEEVNKWYLTEFSGVDKNNLWEINFQDPATPTAEHIIQIHNYVFFFLTVVLIFVVYNMYRILMSFWWIIPDNTAYSKKDLSVLKSLSKIRFTHNTAIEVIWTIIPTLILIAIAIPSFGLLYAMDDVIDPDMTLKVVGHQWYWSYEYSDLDHVFDFKSTIGFDSYMLPEDELILGTSRLLEVDNAVILPIGAYIRINVTSADVLHCWAVPSLGTKIDAVPHRINTGLIYLQRTGVFYGQCSEICGVNHGFMPIVVQSLTIDDFMSRLDSLVNPVLNELINDDASYEDFRIEDNSIFEKFFTTDFASFDLFKLVYYLSEGNYTYNTEKFMLYDAALTGIYNNTEDYDSDAFFDFFAKEVFAADMLMWYIDRIGPFAPISNIAEAELATITDDNLFDLYINYLKK
jgi:cytochrome c oxidase subunit 2